MQTHTTESSGFRGVVNVKDQGGGYAGDLLVGAVGLGRFFVGKLHESRLFNDDLPRVIARSVLRFQTVKSVLGRKDRDVFPSLAHAGYLLAEHKAKTGETLRILEDVPRIVSKAKDVRSLGMASLLKKGQNCLPGWKVRRRARELGFDFGLGDAEATWRMRDSIPKRLRFKHLLFPGTLFCDQDDRLHVTGLIHNGAAGPGWQIGFPFLDYARYDLEQLVCWSYQEPSVQFSNA